jgi:hypothetical protein
LKTLAKVLTLPPGGYEMMEGIAEVSPRLKGVEMTDHAVETSPQVNKLNLIAALFLSGAQITQRRFEPHQLHALDGYALVVAVAPRGRRDSSALY